MDSLRRNCIIAVLAAAFAVPVLAQALKPLLTGTPLAPMAATS